MQNRTEITDTGGQPARAIDKGSDETVGKPSPSLPRAPYTPPAPVPVSETRTSSVAQIAYCPWRHLGHMEGVALRWHRGGVNGLTTFDDKTISLRLGMDDAERRATLAHELVHLERGPVEAGTTRCEEAIVELSAALRLVPSFVVTRLPELVDKYGRKAACAFLGIDDYMLSMLDWFVHDTRTEGGS